MEKRGWNDDRNGQANAEMVRVVSKDRSLDWVAAAQPGEQSTETRCEEGSGEGRLFLPEVFSAHLPCSVPQCPDSSSGAYSCAIAPCLPYHCLLDHAHRHLDPRRWQFCDSY